MRLESALEIVGALKSSFGEARTVSDICRVVSLSYQPVYEYVRRLAARGALSVEKRGQRLLCRPAATTAGALWLAQWSLEEVRRVDTPSVREHLELLNSRITADVLARAPVVALDPGEVGPAVYTTDPTFARARHRITVQVVDHAQLARMLAGPDRKFGVARRVLPVCGHQRLWSIALGARDREAPIPPARPRSRCRRRPQPFID